MLWQYVSGLESFGDMHGQETHSRQNQYPTYIYTRTHLYTTVSVSPYSQRAASKGSVFYASCVESSYVVASTLKELGTIHITHGTLTFSAFKSSFPFVHIGTFPRIWLTGALFCVQVYALSGPTIGRRVFDSLIKGAHGCIRRPNTLVVPCIRVKLV